MSPRHLEEMGLDPERVAARIRFLLAYANSVPGRAREPGVSAEMLSPSLRPIDEWTVEADAATALREAAQWSFYTDPRRAIERLQHSGDRFIDLGLGLGLYLDAVARRPNVTSEQRRSREHQVLIVGALRAMIEDDPSSEYFSFVANPPQQAYTLCAAAATPAVVADHSDLLEDIVEGSLHRTGVIPVGALGTPIHRYWALADELINHRGDVEALAVHLGAMAARYAETMELAQVNSHLWVNCAAAVDVGDIDIAGIGVLVARGLGQSVMEQIIERSQHLGRIAVAPLEIGLEVAGIQMGIRRGERPDRPRYGA